VIKLEETFTPTRREFCACCSKAAGLVALGAVAGCGGSSPTGPSDNAQSLTTVSSTVSGRTVSVSMAAGSPLASTGAMAITQTSIGTFLLTRTGPTSVSVLTATCTHEGCAVTGFSGSQFVCPCHGSTFSTSGAVVKGPANRPLTSFAAQVSGDVASFTA
jgi:nitrite reductase/ring-hydroxylating ferredoxin subunit